MRYGPRYFVKDNITKQVGLTTTEPPLQTNYDRSYLHKQQPIRLGQEDTYFPSDRNKVYCSLLTKIARHSSYFLLPVFRFFFISKDLYYDISKVLVPSVKLKDICQ